MNLRNLFTKQFDLNRLRPRGAARKAETHERLDMDSLDSCVGGGIQEAGRRRLLRPFESERRCPLTRGPHSLPHLSAHVERDSSVGRTQMKKHTSHLILIACALAAVHETAAAALGQRWIARRAMRSLFTASPAFHVYDVQTRARADALQPRCPGGVRRRRRRRNSGAANFCGQRRTAASSNDGLDDVSAQASLTTHTRENIGVSISGSMPIVSSLQPSISPVQPQATANLSIPLPQVR